MLCDYHVHSYYSDDSEYLMEDIVKDAISKNLDEICFTDHVDYGIKVDPMGKSKAELENCFSNVNYPSYFKEIKELQKKYDGKITIKKGMEFGIQTHTIPEFEQLFSKYKHDIDFIIMSCHQVENKEFWNQDYQTGRSQKEYNERYYEEILAVIKQYKDYSVLGHLDLINRYDMAGIYPFLSVRDVIEEILRIVIEDGKGIELNTSSFRYGLKDLTPGREILKLYKDMGGKILTIGSDSHEPIHLGAYISDGMKELKQFGFQTICTYEDMIPAYHKLDVME